VIQSNPEIRDPQDVRRGAGFAGWIRRRRPGDHASRTIRCRYL